MAAPLEVVGPKAGAAPLTYTLTELGTVDLQTIFARFDGSAAAGSYRPTVRIEAQDGTVLAQVFPSETLAAGDSAGVTFAPFLRAATSSGPTAATYTQSMSTPGPLSAQTGTMTWRVLDAGTLTAIDLELGSAPTGSGVSVTAKVNGVSIGSVTIAAGARHGTITASPAALAAGDLVTYDITAVGSTLPGSDLAVQFVEDLS